MNKKILILDLNSTFSTGYKYFPESNTYDISQETYRQWICKATEALGLFVVMITARPLQYEAQTLDNIAMKTGWQPDRAHFNTTRLRAPNWKQKVLTERVFPEFGDPNGQYYALESNAETTAMFKRNGIPAMRQDNPGAFQALKLFAEGIKSEQGSMF